MEINKETKQKFEKFLSEVDKAKPRDAIVAFRRYFLLKETPLLTEKTIKEYRNVANSTKIDKEILFLIEEAILEKPYPWARSFFFKLLIKTKTKISNETLKKLCDEILKSKDYISKSEEIKGLGFYILALDLKEYCNFFKTIIDAFVEKNFYQAGDISCVAARMGCLNCYDSIKKILKVNDTPRSLYFAKKALKILDEKRNKNE